MQTKKSQTDSEGAKQTLSPADQKPHFCAHALQYDVNSVMEIPSLHINGNSV